MLIGYARVSTCEQKLDLQLDALRAAGCERIFRDEGVSGTLVARLSLTKAKRALRKGDTLVVWGLDRLERSLPHLIQTVNEFSAKGVQFHSLREALNTTSSGGKLFFHILAALAEFERNLISERTIAGLDAARARGITLGCPKKLSPEQLTQLHSCIHARQPIMEIAKHFGVSPRTVGRLKEIEFGNSSAVP